MFPFLRPALFQSANPLRPPLLPFATALLQPPLFLLRLPLAHHYSPWRPLLFSLRDRRPCFPNHPLIVRVGVGVCHCWPAALALPAQPTWPGPCVRKASLGSRVQQCRQQTHAKCGHIRRRFAHSCSIVSLSTAEAHILQAIPRSAAWLCRSTLCARAMGRSQGLPMALSICYGHSCHKPCHVAGQVCATKPHSGMPRPLLGLPYLPQCQALAARQGSLMYRAQE